ncbi:MAG: WhiB family transcriptional regulator [Streptomyces sp.]|uniref:WhiB family transcriptional regulator n=1 Tax=Streptomyces sp. TaxID=1931 RepID=UPI0025D68D15|nr:WhiB family transcriptional regulator [Streptomyces sp.]MBW8793223.1 WhiB family transcriptional regulator [Streptomyces sp.]
MATAQRDHATHWREQGACVRLDPDLFFPIGDGGLTHVQVAEAKAVCRRCPVMEQCLGWAMRVEQVDGIWGGTTEGERRLMRRRDGAEHHLGATHVTSTPPARSYGWKQS